VTASIERSLIRLNTDVLDLVLVHSNGNDLFIQQQTDIVETLSKLKQAGHIKHVGFSGKTVTGATEALTLADCIMVEYNLNDRTHEAVIAQAAKQGVGTLIKKGLASGYLGPEEAIRFVLKNQNVGSLIVGGLNLDHIQANLQTAVGLDDGLGKLAS